MLPQAIATGYIHIGTIAGKLNGVMPAQTPSGWRSECVSIAGPTLRENSPFRRCGMPQANSTTSMPRCDLAERVGVGLAVLGARSRSAMSVGVLVEQLLEAEHERGRASAAACRPRPAAPAFAAATAASSSAAVESGRTADCSPVAGLKTGACAGSSTGERRRSRCRRSACLGLLRSRWNAGSIVESFQLTRASSGCPAACRSARRSRAFWMISGGDMAMMSPVVRIRMPFSKAFEEGREGALGRRAGDRLELDRADRPRLRMSMTCGRPFSEWSASSQ